MKKHKVTDGNQISLREALELAITIGDWCCAQTDDPLECCEFSCAYQVEPHGEAGADCPWKKIRAALAAPARNCDRDLSDRQSIWKEFCQWVRSSSLGCVLDPSARDAFEWLLAPAAERKAKD